MMDQTNKWAYQSASGPSKFRFGSFEVDLELRELRSRGLRVRLQHKPFKVLELLLRNPGSLVRREELMQQLWPNLHVNFDHGLNTAVNTLRQVLGDSLRNCRYIETLPGLGYRFLMPVEAIAQTAPAQRGNFEAQQDYLKGKYFSSKLSEDDLRKSIAYFESAIALDPGFALADVGLANAYTLAALLGTMSPAEAHRRAAQWIATALRIGDALPEAWISLAGIKEIFDRDWSGAESECLRSLQSNPSYAGARQAYATLLAVTERLDEALEEIRRARELDPLSVVIGMQMAWILYLAGDFQGAIEQSWKALTLEPKFAAAQHTLGLAYEQIGLIDEAIIEFQNARSCSVHNPAAIAALGHAYSLAGEAREARRTLEELAEMSQRRYVSPYWKSVVCVGIGAHDLALQALNECWEQHDVWLILLRVDPRLDPIRDNTQFCRLLKQINFSAP
jgi:DNA-binding winged helix-turn-helix (wHTH) protein/Flp pilus assembly protein TadD